MFYEPLNDLALKCEAALGVPVVKGYPSWGRPAAQPPILALELANAGVAPIARIGETQRRMYTPLRFFVFARNEPELWLLLAKLMVLLTGLGTYKVGTTTVVITLPQDGQRHPNANEVQEEAYAFIVPVTVTCQGG
jgi:hypothetical protein